MVGNKNFMLADMFVFGVSTLTCRHQAFDRQGNNCQNQRAEGNFNEAQKVIPKQPNETGRSS